MRLFIIALCSLLALVFAADTVKTLVKIVELQECRTWASQAVEFKAQGYYIAQWQKDQCDRYMVKIQSPVKN